MEFIICSTDKMEKGRLPDSATFDFDIGDTNDVEIICEKGFLDFGMYLICPGTEYGTLIEENIIPACRNAQQSMSCPMQKTSMN